MGPRTHTSGSNDPDRKERLVSPCCHARMTEDDAVCPECKAPCEALNDTDRADAV